jgi:hypothetical protein
MMHPYILKSKIAIIVWLYNKPRLYADRDSAIGETIATPHGKGFLEAQVGHAQAWYYHADKTIVLWECFLITGTESTIIKRCGYAKSLEWI